ncbi:hypothetical protein H0H81_004682 [Sphagnurus paluster]|uniref:coproporphyrinogen oxidase n=1 Tax=Sphagnurus paluster TaxID=117069 RepID=A0A9P7GS95_9AGAR|nr:hypothetical protein H0H81_004682 [Sphagnurus paluster]
MLSSESSLKKPMRAQVEEFVVSLQSQIVSAFETLDPLAPAFKRDSWVRPEGGTGQSCVFAVGVEDACIGQESVLEKAGVNTSIVHGILPPGAIKQMRTDHTSIPLPDRPDRLPFFAGGISLVIHPRNPNAPTVHANYRYFEITEPDGEDTDQDQDASQPKVIAWWFGGGCDLTPSYLFEQDAPTFKKWCDEYFYIPHRNEARGIGGIFFDDLNEGPRARLFSTNFPEPARRPISPIEIFAFIQDLGNSFLPSYLPILTSRHFLPYTPLQRRWQLIRRGRYVEFNLVYDRGTQFGLLTPGARIESILVSLPEIARWEYMCELGGEGTEEGNLMDVLKKPRDWV